MATSLRRAGPCFVLLATLACSRERVSVASGEIVYQRYCAACHGMTGRGDGPAAAALSPPPTDLTRLTYDLDGLMRRIDGRETVRAHGSPRMPVWGDAFGHGLVGEDPPSRRARLHVKAAAVYVKSLQQQGG
jgi:mono/diheme cytochrome c family protein